MPYDPSPQIKLAVWMLVLLSLILLSSRFFRGPFKQIIPFISSGNEESSNSKSLQKIVEKNLQGKEGQYSIYIEDLTDTESYSLKASEIFPAASLYKVFLMAAVLSEVEEGSLGLDDNLSSTKSHLTDILGEVDYGYDQAGEEIGYSVEEALTRIGRVSDNFAAIMLAEKVGWNKVQSMAEGLGTRDTFLKDPITTTAFDIALFFKKLYQKQVVSTAVSDKIETYLSLSQLNNRIPALLPEDVRVIHKTGELARTRHDAGLVYLEGRPARSASQSDAGGPYVIVMMSQDLKYEDEGVEVLANISKDVFDYFKNKSGPAGN